MASITLNVPAGSTARIMEAVGYHMNLGQPATAAEVKQFIIQHLKNAVIRYDLDQAELAAQASLNKIEDIT